MDGWEVLATLKSDPATAETPVVIVSMLDEHGAGLALGAAEYLVKPVSQDELMRVLLRWAPLESRKTVVAIDDDETALAPAEAALGPAGWSVLTARDGEQGLELVRRSSPDIVLLDLLMPGLDGFTVAEQLRADPLLAEIPIIVMTAKDLSRLTGHGSGHRRATSSRRARCRIPSSPSWWTARAGAPPCLQEAP